MREHGIEGESEGERGGERERERLGRKREGKGLSERAWD